MSCVANVAAHDVVGIVRLRHQVAGVHTDLGNANIICISDSISSVYWLVSSCFYRASTLQLTVRVGLS